MKDLKNTTFIIPVKLDTEDRIHNLNSCISYLTHHLDTNIIIWEEDDTPKVTEKLRPELLEKCKVIFNKQPKDFFHRTRILNEMVKIVETPVVVNYDCDVLLEPDNYEIAQMTIMDDKFDVCYPYDGKMYDIHKKFFDGIDNENTLNGVNLDECDLMHPNSLGGCFFISTKKYLESGIENEYFLSWGYEDNERFARFKKLDYRVGRLPGPLYHMWHERGNDSNFSNPFIKNNERELQKIYGLQKNELINYISSWPWRKK
tara:strand:+ start:5189 stop:5965 length:777 start_codon:yes stop_codon:yes gene_type:complete